MARWSLDDLRQSGQPIRCPPNSECPPCPHCRMPSTSRSVSGWSEAFIPRRVVAKVHESNPMGRRHERHSAGVDDTSRSNSMSMRRRYPVHSDGEIAASAVKQQSAPPVAEYRRGGRRPPLTAPSRVGARRVWCGGCWIGSIAQKNWTHPSRRRSAGLAHRAPRIQPTV